MKRKIESIRADLGYTQADMAKVLGMKYVTYQKKEQGKSPWLATEILMISEISKVPVTDIHIIK